MLKQEVTWKQGEKESNGVYVKDKQLIYIGLPIQKNQSLVSMTNSSLSFEVSFDGHDWYTVNDYDGLKFLVKARATNEVEGEPSIIFSNKPDDYRYGILPIKNRELFHGMIMFKIKGDKAELGDRTIALFLE